MATRRPSSRTDSTSRWASGRGSEAVGVGEQGVDALHPPDGRLDGDVLGRDISTD
jgi:hypothetical protein